MRFHELRWTFAIQDHILRFEIPVQDIEAVQVLDREDHLRDVELGPRLRRQGSVSGLFPLCGCFEGVRWCGLREIPLRLELLEDFPPWAEIEHEMELVPRLVTAFVRDQERVLDPPEDVPFRLEVRDLLLGRRG